MSLIVSSRILGDVFVMECAGQIVLGEESRTFQSEFETAAREFCRIVLAVSGVTRFDSSGIGLLVRCMSRLRRRGGDLRLAAPQPFLQSLLHLTRLTSVLKAFPTEEEAAESFVVEANEAASRRVIVVDQSPDFGVFIRAVLAQRGMEVRMTGFVHEVRLLVKCQPVDFILLGPGNWQPSARTSLQKWAPRATILELSSEFRSFDAGKATETLLEILQIGAEPS